MESLGFFSQGSLLFWLSYDFAKNLGVAMRIVPSVSRWDFFDF